MPITQIIPAALGNAGVQIAADQADGLANTSLFSNSANVADAIAIGGAVLADMAMRAAPKAGVYLTPGVGAAVAAGQVIADTFSPQTLGDGTLDNYYRQQEIKQGLANIPSSYYTNPVNQSLYGY